MSDECGDLEPSGLIEVADGRPVDAEARAGDPLGRPDQRSRETPDHRNGMPVDLVVYRRMQVEHRRVEHYARHLRGKRRALEERGDDTAAHRLADEDDTPGTLLERPAHRRLEVSPLCLPVPEVTRRVAGGTEVVAVGHREGGESQLTRDVDHPQQVLAGAVLPVHADDERAVPAGEIPRGQRPERARYDYVPHGDAQRRFRAAKEAGPVEGSELPDSGSRPGGHGQRTRHYVAGHCRRGAELPGAALPGDTVEHRLG